MRRPFLVKMPERPGTNVRWRPAAYPTSEGNLGSLSPLVAILLALVSENLFAYNNH